MPNSSGPKINTTDNPTGHPITKRDLAKLTGYSYEHIRKMLKGEPVPSREFNRKLCEVLGLEEDRTWQLAVGEKLAKRARDIDPQFRPPSDDRVAALWTQLSPDDQLVALRLIEGLVGSRRRLEGALTLPPAAPPAAVSRWMAAGRSKVQKTAKPEVPKRHFRIEFTVGQPGPDNPPKMNMFMGRDEQGAVRGLLRDQRSRSGGQITKQDIHVVSITEGTEREAFRHAADLLQKYHNSEKAKLRKE